MCYTSTLGQCVLVQHEFFYTHKTKWEQLFAKHGNFEYVPSAPGHDSETLQFTDLNVEVMSSPLTTSLVL